MKVTVIAPHASHVGRTSLAILVAMELSKGFKKTCVCHTKPISDDMYTYLNFNKFEDKTSSPSQLVKMLREGDVEADSLSDYCKFVTESFEVFTNRSTNFTVEDMEYITEYIINKFPHENIVVDVDNVNSEFNKKIISKCDVVILCITQDVLEAENFYKNREEFSELTKDKPVITVVNKFNSTKSSIKELASWLHIKKPNGWLILHDNPWVAWATNHGELNQLYRVISKKDSRTIGLDNELNKIVAKLVQAKNTSFSKRK